MFVHRYNVSSRELKFLSSFFPTMSYEDQALYFCQVFNFNLKLISAYLSVSCNLFKLYHELKLKILDASEIVSAVSNTLALNPPDRFFPLHR